MGRLCMPSAAAIPIQAVSSRTWNHAGCMCHNQHGPTTLDRPGLAHVSLAGQCLITSTCGLVAMTSASHAEGRQLDPGQV